MPGRPPAFRGTDGPLGRSAADRHRTPRPAGGGRGLGGPRGDRNGNFKHGLWTRESVAAPHDRSGGDGRDLLRATRGSCSRKRDFVLAAPAGTAYIRVMWRASAGKRRPPVTSSRAFPRGSPSRRWARNGSTPCSR